MISPGFLFKCVGRHILSNNHSIRLLVLSLGPTIVHTPLAGLKSQKIIQLPEKPKKPQTGFLRYVQDRRLELTREHPELKPQDIIKRCSEDWKTAHPTIKQKYENDFKKELATYAKKFLEYSSELTEEQKAYIAKINDEKRNNLKQIRAKRLLRILNKPKRPPSAYSLYLMNLAIEKNIKYNELLKSSKGEWEKVDQSIKREYEEKHKQAKMEYERDLEEWEIKMLQEGKTDLVRKSTLETKRPSTAKEIENQARPYKKNSIKKKIIMDKYQKE